MSGPLRQRGFLFLWKDRKHHSVSVDERNLKRARKPAIPHGRLAGPVMASQDHRQRLVRLLLGGLNLPNSVIQRHHLMGTNFPSLITPISTLPLRRLTRREGFLE